MRYCSLTILILLNPCSYFLKCYEMPWPSSFQVVKRIVRNVVGARFETKKIKVLELVMD